MPFRASLTIVLGAAAAAYLSQTVAINGPETLEPGVQHALLMLLI